MILLCSLFLYLSTMVHGQELRAHKDTFVCRGAFQDVADFIFDDTDDWATVEGHKTFNPNNVKKGDIVFVRRVSLSRFFANIHPYISNPYILLTHIDDHSAPGEFKKYLDDPKVAFWVGINQSINYHPKFIPIPIGIWQIKEFYKNKVSMNQLFTQLRQNTKSKLLYMNFGLWSNPKRTLIKNLFLNKSFCFVSNNSKKPYREYLEEMAEFKFVLSPPGNGLDCHRTWEALLVGCIPIVESSRLDLIFDGLPVLIIRNWAEITEDFLNKKYIQFKQKKYNYDKLYMDYWIKKINELKRKV